MDNNAQLDEDSLILSRDSNSFAHGLTSLKIRNEYGIAVEIYKRIFNLIINKYSPFLDVTNLMDLQGPHKLQRSSLIKKVTQIGEKGHPLIIEIFLLPLNYSSKNLFDHDFLPAFLVEQWNIQLVPKRLVEKIQLNISQLIDQLSDYFDNSSLKTWLMNQSHEKLHYKLIYRISNLNDSCQLNPYWVALKKRDLIECDSLSLMPNEISESDYGSPNKVYTMNINNSSASPVMLKERFLNSDYNKITKSFPCAQINATDVLEMKVLSIGELPLRPIFFQAVKSNSQLLYEDVGISSPEKIRKLDPDQDRSYECLFQTTNEDFLNIEDSLESQDDSLSQNRGQNGLDNVISSLSTLTTNKKNMIKYQLIPSDQTAENEGEDCHNEWLEFKRKTQVEYSFNPTTGLPLSISPMPANRYEHNLNYHNQQKYIVSNSSYTTTPSRETNNFLVQFPRSNDKLDINTKEVICKCKCDVCSSKQKSNGVSDLTSPIAIFSINLPNLKQSKPADMEKGPVRVEHSSKYEENLKRRPTTLKLRPSEKKSLSVDDITKNDFTTTTDLSLGSSSSNSCSPLDKKPNLNQVTFHATNKAVEASNGGDVTLLDDDSPTITLNNSKRKKTKLCQPQGMKKDKAENRHDSLLCTCYSKLIISPTTVSNHLLVNFEESMLNGRINPLGMVDGFEVELGASGSFFPRHARLTISSYFFRLSNDNAPSPYLGYVDLRKLTNRKGYQVPKTGAVQLTLFNPNKTVVKMFLIGYDFSDMPSNSQTFLRHRTFSVPTAVKNSNYTSQSPPHMTSCSPTSIMIVSKWLKLNNSQKTMAISSLKPSSSNLRYSIHLKFHSTKSNKIFLHSDIRMIFSRDDKCESDTNCDNQGPTSYELHSCVEAPNNPRYSLKI